MSVVALLLFLVLPGSNGTASNATDRFTGDWVAVDGSPASRDENSRFSYEVLAEAEPEHCDWGEYVNLNVAWPLGATQVDGPPDVTRVYVRDVDDETGSGEALDLEADLPQGSRASGYRTGDVELWFGPDGGEQYAYLVEGDDVERWPRPAHAPACA